jgi:hypothetical protein
MKRFTYLHPFFFALYAVVGVYALNANEVPLAQIVKPLVISLIIAALVLYLIKRLTNDTERAAFITTLVFLWAIYFGHVDRFTSFYPSYRRIPNYRLITLATWTAVLLSLGSTWVWKRLVKFHIITTLLNVTSSIVLIIPIVTTIIVGTQSAKFSKVIEVQKQKSEIPLLQVGDITPDIYYIIVDGYGRADVLQKYYSFDNNEFIDFLTKKGFYVASQSRSNYLQTELSLSSLLNLGYINYLADEMGSSINRGPLTELIMHSQVRRSLEEAGYQFVAMPSATLFTQIRDADVYYTYTRSRINEFEALLLSTTIFNPIIEDLDLDIPLPNYQTERETILFTLEKLKEIPRTPGPKFVFTHILSPHPPFVFDQNGNPVEANRPYFIGDGAAYYGSRDEYVKGYTSELVFLNRKLEETITAILENSEHPPIIIIHGDHGPGAFTEFTSLEENCLVDRVPILNAYYFPAQQYEKLYPSITLVNSFRVVFDTFFNLDLPLLVDRSYYSDPLRPYMFIDVTDHVMQNTCKFIESKP